jgi:hypothetical protein
MANSLRITRCGSSSSSEAAISGSRAVGEKFLTLMARRRDDVERVKFQSIVMYRWGTPDDSLALFLLGTTLLLDGEMLVDFLIPFLPAMLGNSSNFL